MTTPWAAALIVFALPVAAVAVWAVVNVLRARRPTPTGRGGSSRSRRSTASNFDD